MYCIRCGKELASKSKFCGNCGQAVQKLDVNNDEPIVDKTQEVSDDINPTVKVESTSLVEDVKAEEVKSDTVSNVRNTDTQVIGDFQYSQGTDIVDNKKNKNKIIGVAIGVAVVAVLAIVLVVMNINKSGYRDYNDLVNDYFEAFEDNKPKLLKNIIHENMLSEIGNEEQIDSALNYMVDSIRAMYDNKLKIVYKISEAEFLKRDELEDYIEELVYEYGFSRDEIEQVKELNIDFLVNGKEEKVYLTVGKINGRWYSLIELN